MLRQLNDVLYDIDSFCIHLPVQRHECAILLMAIPSIFRLFFVCFIAPERQREKNKTILVNLFGKVLYDYEINQMFGYNFERKTDFFYLNKVYGFSPEKNVINLKLDPNFLTQETDASSQRTFNSFSISSIQNEGP